MSQFKPTIDLSISELPIETLFRFAEIELNKFAQNHPLGLDYATAFISSYLANEETSQDVFDLVRSHAFRNPRKSELVDYFRYMNQTYTQTIKKTGVSSRTIARRRYELPIYLPIFRYWSKGMLKRWNDQKHFYNIWNEPLIQTSYK